MKEDISYHILIVDDDDKIRNLLRNFLISNSFLVSTAQNGNHALEKIKLINFDIIIVDIMMPGIDGYELTKIIRTSSLTPIIHLTAMSNTENVIELISNELDLPNGLALSNDERYLYVNSSNTAEAPVILRVDLENNNNSELFFDGAELAKEYPGNFDGLKVHSSGNIFTTGPNGILVLSEDGKLLANIEFNDMLTNCTFNSDESYLYVTGFTSVARISLKND